MTTKSSVEAEPATASEGKGEGKQPAAKHQAIAPVSALEVNHNCSSCWHHQNVTAKDMAIQYGMITCTLFLHQPTFTFLGSPDNDSL